MGNRDRMKKAIEERAKKKPGAKPVAKPDPKAVVEAASTQKRPNWRSARARDARAKERGRLPHGTRIETTYLGRGVVSGVMTVPALDSGETMFSVSLSGDGHFELSERLDVAFWEWMASPDGDAARPYLTFDDGDYPPEPMKKGVV